MVMVGVHEYQKRVSLMQMDWLTAPSSAAVQVADTGWVAFQIRLLMDDP